MSSRRRIVLFAAIALLALAGPAAGVSLDGTWIGNLRDGTPTVWQLESGRLRRDGRPADYEVHDDSLIVHFDAAGEDAPSETAVYRFLASDAAVGHPRLFLYGFDLGKQGLHLVRDLSEKAPLAEDVAPAPPEPPAPTPPRTAPPSPRP